MNDMLCRAWWMPAVRGIVALAFGFAALLWPGLTLFGLVALFAGSALLAGAVSVLAALRHRTTHDDWWMPLLPGGIAIGAGVLALLHPGLSITLLVLLIGANALVSGVLDIAMAIRLRKSIEDEWLLALAGLLAILFGVLVFLFPGAGALALVWMISVHALVSGVLLMSLAVRLRKAAGGTPGFVIERRVHPDRRIVHAH